ncbi:BspA family leucine-rich repeat surface protein [Candidatus Saccharibacteria bacterium]|nr:BspA family leucine-rich repeat surface protein [Candidatus Saccharibacteria bacterium]
MKSNIIFALPALAFILFAAAIVFPVVPVNTHAEGDEPEEGISVVASSDISVNLLSKDEGYYKIFKDSIKVSTSSENGYTLSIATDGADHQTLYLNGDTTSESKIDGATGTYENPEVLGDYEWGFAVPGISHFDDTYSTTNPSEDSKFAILPLENKIIRDYTEAVSDNITDIYYGFKLSGTLELGEYETSITYTAIPADQPLAAKAVLGDNGNLNFLYNRNTYTVGETYTDNVGETTITNFYDNIPLNGTEEDIFPWAEQSDSVFTANFDKSFANARMTDCGHLFRNLKKLTTITNPQNLNTSQVVNMRAMFAYAGNDASTFAVDLGSWDISNTTNMSSMFYSAGYNATAWEISGIGSWNTSSLTNAHAMFYKAGYYATTWSIGDISGWDTSHIEDMGYLFAWAGYSVDEWSVGDLVGWDTSSVTNLMGAFSNAGYASTTWSVGDISHWNTGKVTNMSYVFNKSGYSAKTLRVDLSGWDTSNATSMKAMFYYFGYSAETFELNIDSWNVGSVTNFVGFLNYAGYGADVFELNLSTWNTGSATDMEQMFDRAGYSATTWSIGDLSGWKTNNVTNMQYMFLRAGYSADTWDLGDLSSWDTSNVTNMRTMFQYAGHSATYWNIGDIHEWNVDNVTNHTNFVDWNQSTIDPNKLPWQSN